MQILVCNDKCSRTVLISGKDVNPSSKLAYVTENELCQWPIMITVGKADERTYATAKFYSSDNVNPRNEISDSSER